MNTDYHHGDCPYWILLVRCTDEDRRSCTSSGGTHPILGRFDHTASSTTGEFPTTHFPLFFCTLPHFSWFRTCFFFFSCFVFHFSRRLSSRVDPFVLTPHPTTSDQLFFELALFFPHRLVFHDCSPFISRFASPRGAIRCRGPHPIECSERTRRTQLGFQRLRTRREAFRRAVEASPHAGRGTWLGGWLHVQKGSVIAGVEVYWTVTSKKLKVMYASLAITLICFIVPS